MEGGKTAEFLGLELEDGLHKPSYDQSPRLKGELVQNGAGVGLPELSYLLEYGRPKPGLQLASKSLRARSHCTRRLRPLHVRTSSEAKNSCHHLFSAVVCLLIR